MKKGFEHAAKVRRAQKTIYSYTRPHADLKPSQTVNFLWTGDREIKLNGEMSSH